MNTEELNDIISKIKNDIAQGREIEPDEILNSLITIRDLVIELQSIVSRL